MNVIDRWVHIGCFTIPNEYNDKYNGDTAIYDFLTNQVIDNTELNMLSTDEGLCIISEQLGSKYGLFYRKKDCTTAPKRMKRKTRSMSAACKKPKAWHTLILA